MGRKRDENGLTEKTSEKYLSMTSFYLEEEQVAQQSDI